MELSINCLNGDCLELMSNLPDKSIDLFLCDLPYGCLKQPKGIIARALTPNEKGCAWDIKIDLDKFWIQVKRLCKNDNTPVLMFCTTKFGIDLISSNRDWFRYDLVWSKNKGTNFLDVGKRPMSNHEMIYVFSKKAAFYKRIDEAVEGKEPYIKPQGIRKGNCFGNNTVRTAGTQDKRCPVSVINFNMNTDKRHPTTKPIDLYKWLIERYSNEGDTILDPTAGSFNSGRASIELNRNYIGMELDKDFYEKNKI